MFAAPWFTDNDLGALLDAEGPLTLRLRTERDKADDSVWFLHPEWDHVFCRIGTVKRGRDILVWGRAAETRIIILTVRMASTGEVALMRELQHERG